MTPPTQIIDRDSSPVAEGFSIGRSELVIGLAVAAIAVTMWVPARAEVFGDLVVAAYDMHRIALYRQLRWPLPTDPENEQVQGKAISAYLQVGSDDPTPIFTQPD